MPTFSLALRAGCAVALASVAPVASAQSQPCAQRAKVIERLAEKYGETLQSVGMQSNNGVLEVYASEETGSWTILVTSPDGTACLIAAGQMWEGDVAPLIKPGKDA
jgi:predicted methyltransferase